MTAQDRGWGPPCPANQIVRITAGGRSFNVHRKVAPIFEAFIHELTTRTNYSIDEGTLDDWSYNCRKIAGSTSWSNHAWGLAIDVNSLRNPMRPPPMVTDMPAWVRDQDYLMGKYGLRWGGEYKTRPDPMHFEFMGTPADADRIAASVDAAPEEDDMTTEQARQLEAIFKALIVPGTTNPEDTMDMQFFRMREVQKGLIPQGTRSVGEAYGLLYARVRNVEAATAQQGAKLDEILQLLTAPTPS